MKNIFESRTFRLSSVLLFLGLVISSAVIGAVGSYRILTGHFPCVGSERQATFRVDEEERMGLQDGFEDEPGDEY